MTTRVYVGQYLFSTQFHTIPIVNDTLGNPRYRVKVPLDTGRSYIVFVPREPLDGDALVVVRQSASGKSFFAHVIRATKARHNVAKLINELLTEM